MRDVTNASATALGNSPATDGDFGSSNVVSNPAPLPKKKICCACPSTKRLRDECIVMHGEDACKKWINAHKECLRSEGFKVRFLALYIPLFTPVLVISDRFGKFVYKFINLWCV